MYCTGMTLIMCHWRLISVACRIIGISNLCAPHVKINFKDLLGTSDYNKCYVILSGLRQWQRAKWKEILESQHPSNYPPKGSARYSLWKWSPLYKRKTWTGPCTCTRFKPGRFLWEIPLPTSKEASPRSTRNGVKLSKLMNNFMQMKVFYIK